MKNLTFIAIFSFFLMGLGFANAQTVAHLNSNTVLEAMPDYKAAQTKLETEATRHKTEVERRQAEIQTILNDAQTQVDAVKDKSDAEKQALMQKLAPVQEDLQKKNEELMNYQKTAAESLNKQEADLVKPIYEKVEAAINAVGSAKNIGYIIDMATAGPQGVVVYYGGGVDITNDVKKQLGL